MNKKVFAVFLRIFFLDFAKRTKLGFTLAEALIITVMTGACLLPILGTMQNAQVRTENFDHQSKMQQYSRSRLTEEIANAAFDHKSVNQEDEYHYIVYFASGTSEDPGSEDDAKLIELARTYVTLEDLASLTSDPNHNNWATAAIDLLGLNKSDKEPYLKIVHAYKTSVETQYNFKLATFSASVDDGEGDGEEEEEPFASPKGLLAIVVKTCLLKSNGNDYDPSDGAMITEFNEDGSIKTKDKVNSVLPVTLFSMANLPTVSDEFIWMVDKHNNKVIGIDPLSRTKSTEITFEEGPDNEPLHIAVHPSGKILAIQCKKKIYLVNIDVKSPYKDSKKVILSQMDDYSDKEHGGIAFRPDGKVLYYINKNYKETEKEPSLVIRDFKFKITDNVLEWGDNPADIPTSIGMTKARINFKNYGDNFTNIVAANDGYLYVGGPAYGADGPGADKEIKILFRYPMYTPFENDQKCNCFQLLNLDYELKDIDVSSDGQFLLCIPKGPGDKTVEIYNTKTGNLVKSISTSQEIEKGIFVSYSDENLSIKDTSLFVALSGKKGDPKKASVEIYSLNDSTWYDLENNYLEANGSIIASPIDGKIVFNSKYKNKETKIHKLFFSDFLYDSENHQLTDDEATDLEEKKTGPAHEVKSEFAAAERDVMAFASDNKIKLFNLNTFKQIDDAEFDAPKILKGITMNPTGDMLLGYYGTARSGYTKFHLKNQSINDNTVPAQSTKYVFDSSVPNIGFSLEDRGNPDNRDAFWELDNDGSNWEPEYGTAYDRRDFDLDVDWKRYDMVGMPNGGALVLYGNSDDGSSMLEWIGKRNWGATNIGKYRLFARWTSGGKYFTKTIPEGTSDFTDAELDQWYGRIHIIKDGLFPVNSIIKSFSAVIGNWSTGEDRFVTFLILEKSGTGFKVIDYSDSFAFQSGTGSVTDRNINWLNGGIIKNSDCRIGFYNGGSDDASTKGTMGAFIYKAFSGADAIHNYFLADYNVIDKVSSGNANDGLAYSTVTNLTETFYEYTGPNKERNYSLNFKAFIPDNSRSFPPLFSRKLAISPDCGTLAILSKNTVSTVEEEKVPLLNIYDFNNYNFGPETQIEGLLVDYRKQKDAGGNNINWPAESSDNVFTKVANKCNFEDSTNAIPCLASATTKNDSWISFNNNPCNYKVFSSSTALSSESDVNQVKGYANKRFLGYLRSEKDINTIALHFTDEPRVFFNSSLLYGVEETDLDNDSLIGFPIKRFNSSLFQLDHASNGEGMNLCVFTNANNGALFTDSDTDCPSVSTPGDPSENYYQINDTNRDAGWIGLVSDKTYLLNNHPTFIASYKILTPSLSIDIDYADMMFSRDRAKPILYIKGKKYLYILNKSKVSRLKNSFTENNSKNLVISSDGQKLIFGNGQDLKVYNISNPDETLLNGGGAIGPYTDPDEYLGEKSISLGSNPEFLANKPYISYKSSNIKGDYNPLCSDSTFYMSSNNSVAVASGGIYIVGKDSTDIAKYNPIASPSTLNTTLFDGALKKENSYGSVSAYDDTLYVFGNDIGADEFLTGRVQSFNVNTGVSLCSLDEKLLTGGDQFWINYCAVEYSGSWGNSGYNNGWSNVIEVTTNGGGTSDTHEDKGGKPEYAFDADNNWGWRSKNNSDPHYLLYSLKTTDLKFAVNMIEINNSKVPDGNQGVKDKKNGVHSFEFYGVDGATENKIGFGDIPKNTSAYVCELSNTANVKYPSYKFLLKTSNDGGSSKNIGVTEVKMYRTGVKRLTPKGSPKTCDLTNRHAVFETEDGDLEVWWSNHYQEDITWYTGIWPFRTEHHKTNHYPLSDVFSNNITLKIDDNTKVWKCNTSKRWVLFKLPTEEAASIVRFCSSKKQNRLTTFKLYGSTASSISVPSQCNSISCPSPWTELFLNPCSPDIDTSFVTFEFDNSNNFKWYLLNIESVQNSSNFELAGLELYSGSGSSNSISTEPPTEDYLTALKNDNLSNIRCDNSAACATPYGLVVTGGLDETELATKTALLYWPHGINRFDGSYYQYGIPRSLPQMQRARANHVLVWHKGKIYAIGGRGEKSAANVYGASGATDFIEVLDYNKKSMAWEIYPKAFTYVDGASSDIKRYNHGACSFGDEIFIFGGAESSSHLRSSALAFNPETGVFRQIKDMGSVKFKSCAAVPFGSKIYLFGNDDADSDIFKVIEYTP